MTAHGHVVFEAEPAEVRPDGSPARPLVMPRPVGRMLAALAVLAIGVAAHAALTGRKAPLAPLGPVEASRVVEVPTGHAQEVDVRDPRTGLVVAQLGGGDAEFLRSVARSLEGPDARRGERIARLEIAWRTGGMLTVTDLATGRTASINAFGQDQVARLGRVLVSRGPAAARSR